MQRLLILLFLLVPRLVHAQAFKGPDQRGNNYARTMSGAHLGTATVPNSALATNPLNASNLSSGLVPAARMPAFSGDTTSSSGTTVTTTLAVNGVAYPASPAVNTIPQVTSTGQVTYLQQGRPPTNIPGSNLTGVDTISLATGNQKLTLTAGANSGTESLTIQAGSITPAASATLPFSVRIRICQDGTGGEQLNFGPGSGVTNFCWGGGGSCATSLPATAGQPGYTLTKLNGDDYIFDYDGTSVRGREILSNVPC